MTKRIRFFDYRLGEITDGAGRPVSDFAFIEIVDGDDPQVMLGEINIEAENARTHAEELLSGLAAKTVLEEIKLRIIPHNKNFPTSPDHALAIYNRLVEIIYGPQVTESV